MMRVVALVLFLLVVPSSCLDAQSSSCSADPGAFFCADFESGTSSAWAPNDPARISIVAPGLNGTTRKVQLEAPGTDSNSFADTSVRHTSPNGEVVWMEYWISFPSNYKWASGPAGVTGAKTFEVFINSPAGMSGRILLVVHALDYTNATSSIGRPEWSLYPNWKGYGGNGPEDDIVRSSVYFSAGNTYHVVTELKVATCCTGYIKMWINNQLALSRSNVQTAINPSLGWQYVRIGGAYGDVGGGPWWYDQIRLTTTNIGPRTPPPSLR